MPLAADRTSSLSYPAGTRPLTPRPSAGLRRALCRARGVRRYDPSFSAPQRHFTGTPAGGRHASVLGLGARRVVADRRDPSLLRRCAWRRDLGPPAPARVPGCLRWAPVTFRTCCRAPRKTCGTRVSGSGSSACAGPPTGATREWTSAPPPRAAGSGRRTLSAPLRPPPTAFVTCDGGRAAPVKRAGPGKWRCRLPSADAQCQFSRRRERLTPVRGYREMGSQRHRNCRSGGDCRAA